MSVSWSISDSMSVTCDQVSVGAISDKGSSHPFSFVPGSIPVSMFSLDMDMQHENRDMAANYRGYTIWVK